MAAVGGRVGARDRRRRPQQVFVGREAEMTHAARPSSCPTLDGNGGLVAGRRRARRRQDHARAPADPRGGAARRVRGVRSLLRVGGHRPVLAVRRDDRAGAVDHAARARPRGPGRGRVRGGADGSRAPAAIPRHPRAARPSRRSSSGATSSTPSARSSAAARERFPLLLVMDDVHWADEPTLLLLEHMAALMAEQRGSSASAPTATWSSK